MANTQLTQTGAQVQADLNRIEALPTPTSADSGKYLGVDSSGNYALISGTPSGYTVTVTNGLSVDHDVVLYDGQDNTGTYLGLLAVNTSDSYVITSGYIYAEWDNPLTQGDVTFAEDGSDIGNPIQVNSNMSIEVWDVEPVVPYLTFSSPNSFTLNVVDNIKYWNGTLEYSTNTTTWNTWSGTSAISSGVSENENVLYMRGRNNSYITGSSATALSSQKCYWVLTGSDISCRGNIENLLDYTTVLQGNHPTMASYCYNYLFYNCRALTTAPSLPATTLTNYCYQQMFAYCTSLTTAPSLPATTLTNYCYSGMFNTCASLTVAPNLPATTLAPYCYMSMFDCCYLLTTAPSLSATTLATYCYMRMFHSCRALVTAPSLPATTLATYCYTAMFGDCRSLVVAPTILATTYSNYSCQSMFSGCIALTTPPEILATTVGTGSLNLMFANCTSLNKIPKLKATTLASGCYQGMFQGCTNIKMSATRTSPYTTAYRIPSSGTGTTASNALANMFISTGGTFTGTPTINTTIYTSNTVV